MPGSSYGPSDGPGPGPALADGGAELQTDVMRFFAILALCVLALSTLVRQLPAETTDPAPGVAPPPDASPIARDLRPPPAPVPIGVSDTEPAPVEPPAPRAAPREPPRPVPEAAPAPPVGPPQAWPPLRRAPVPPMPLPENPASRAREAVPQSLSPTRPLPEPAPVLNSKPPPAPQPERNAVPETRRAPGKEPGEPAMAPAEPDRRAPPVPSAPPARLGFTLRFASDSALTALLLSGEVRLHVQGDGGGAYRWRDGQFEREPLPPALYLMHEATVPAALAKAFNRDTGQRPLTWGVTLPAPTRRAIERTLTERERGDLVIDARGAVALEGG